MAKLLLLLLTAIIASASCASIEVNITKGEEQVATSELSVPKVRQDELILEEKTSETPAASLDTDLGIPLTLNKKPLVDDNSSEESNEDSSEETGRRQARWLGHHGHRGGHHAGHQSHHHG